MNVLKPKMKESTRQPSCIEQVLFKRPQKALIVARFFLWPKKSSADVQKKEIGNRLVVNGIETHLVSYNPVKPTNELKFQYHHVKKSFFNLVTFGLGVRRLISRIRPDFILLTQAFGYFDLINLIRAASGIPIFYWLGASFPLCTRFIGDQFDGRAPCKTNFFESPLKCLFGTIRSLRDASRRETRREINQWWRIEILKRLFWDSFFFIPLMNFLVRHYLKKIHMIMTVNSYLKRELDRILDGVVPIVVVPNGVDTNVFISKKEKVHKTKKMIYFPGRSDDPAKGLSVLLRAAELLHRKRKDFELMIDKPVPNLPTYVKVNEWVRDPHIIVKRYQMADVVVIPSLCHDACPLTLLEAMSCGIPVIASNIGGPSDILKHEKNGFLVTPGDFRDLARKLEILLENEDLAARMGASSRKKMEEKYTWDNIFTNQILPLLSK